MTALHWAVFHENETIVGHLLESGADANATTEYQVSPLAIACSKGNDRIVQRLLQANAKVNDRGLGQITPLMIASRQGDPNVVQRLIESGAEVDLVERSGQTALMWAAANGNSQAVKHLIRGGAETTRALPSGFNAFFFAARHGHINVIKQFLESGQDINAVMNVQSKGGRSATNHSSALVLAVESGHFELALWLVDNGADPNDQRSGHAPLHMLSWVRKPKRSDGVDGDPPPRGSGSTSSLDFARQLVQRGAHVNLQLENGRAGKAQLNPKGATPLLYACKTADLPLIKVLLELGADLQLPNADGCTPFLAAAGVGTAAVDEEPGTESEVLDTLAFLLTKNVAIDGKSSRGDTAMHGAAFRAFPKVVSFLYERGLTASVWDHKDEFGWSPFDISDGKRPGSVKPNPEVRQALTKALENKGS
jgi:ankyrin repeat protein